MSGTTLREMFGLNTSAPALAHSAVVLVDLQNTYTRGALELEGWKEALAEAEKLLRAAREAGAPVIHVQHDGGDGTPYDVNAEIGRIHADIAPVAGETVVTKTEAPSAFLGTDLDEVLRRTGKKNVVVAGFMTHMCVQYTAADASLRGYHTVVVAGASATRDIRTVTGVIRARDVHDGALATISDRYGVVVDTVADLA
ncbi:cysteine hydrolase family protein [Streptomyces viridochromogenes]|uniref:Putative Isochorismatase hydrolase n=1 Tax=Streptomyces viridochromogenes Tue57 TaxID=1160705 RepID=L8P964_STRVR|nr:cysteine hydrolase family protein [Streptomyces viridochromogenes]ELS52698.1 putative Isochorismatase hydrolase [Streptomyces viridochromogenes Tue57]